MSFHFIQCQRHICSTILFFWLQLFKWNLYSYIARFAIDKMQSVFLNEFGGEMAAHPRYPETSLVQHIFGGCLQSQVACIDQFLFLFV